MLNNLNSFFTVTLALQMSLINRLKEAFHGVPENFIQFRDKAQALCSPLNNFANLREYTMNISPPGTIFSSLFFFVLCFLLGFCRPVCFSLLCFFFIVCLIHLCLFGLVFLVCSFTSDDLGVPYLGIFLKDLVIVNEAKLPDLIKEAKSQNIVDMLHRWQATPYRQMKKHHGIQVTARLLSCCCWFVVIIICNFVFVCCRFSFVCVCLLSFFVCVCCRYLIAP
jgi:hypothetical protein